MIALAGRFDGDNEGQVTAIENLVRQGVSGILITPSSTGGVLGAIKSARQQGVVVIALDTATEPEDVVDATFATNNKQAVSSASTSRQGWAIRHRRSSRWTSTRAPASASPATTGSWKAWIAA